MTQLSKSENHLGNALGVLGGGSMLWTPFDGVNIFIVFLLLQSSVFLLLRGILPQFAGHVRRLLVAPVSFKLSKLLNSLCCSKAMVTELTLSDVIRRGRHLIIP